MATIALHSAATGLSALSTQIDVIAHNLANVNTTAFKSSRVNFEDLLYQQMAQPGVENTQGVTSPTGLQVGLGVRVANTDLNFTQGAVLHTGQDLDVMIDGDGFFQVERTESPNGIAYTRAGNFFVNRDGELVLGNRNGLRLEPAITVPTDVKNITISRDGRVEFLQADGSVSQADLEIVTFVNPRGLRTIGGNLFEETIASGDPLTGTPGEDGRGEIVQGTLEASNVNPVTELVELIKTQRAFEMNSQSIQTADEALQVVANLRRL